MFKKNGKKILSIVLFLVLATFSFAQDSIWDSTGAYYVEQLDARSTPMGCGIPSYACYIPTSPLMPICE